MDRDEIRLMLTNMIAELEILESEEELSVPEENWAFFIKTQIEQFIDSMNFHDIMKGKK